MGVAMSDIINKAFLAGLGALSLTREKIEGFIDELAKKGEIAKGDKETLVDNLQKEVEKRRAEFREFIAKETKKVLSGLNIPTREEVDALKKEIAELREQISASGEGR